MPLTSVSWPATHFPGALSIARRQLPRGRKVARLLSFSNAKDCKMSNGFTEINKDTENARRGIKPDVLTDTYGPRPPAGAVFDKGFSDRAGASEAQNARRHLRPGDYDSK
jgi:hypothetical protein